MAAVDTFESFLNALSAVDKSQLKVFIKEQQAEMFAARSEDARTRIAHDFVMEAHDLLKKK